jgi:hypothetical protein
VLVQVHAHEQQRHRELVGDVLELITDLDRGFRPPPQKMQVIHDQEPNLAGQKTIQGTVGELGVTG